jgi:hypothetical protein
VPEKEKYSYTKYSSSKMASSINNNLSLYIPRVFRNITKERIESVFENLGFGRVRRVDLINKENSDLERYNSAYVHFEEWFDTPANRAFQERVVDSERDARVVYDDPWYWIVLENKTKKRSAGDRKPCINIGQVHEDRNEFTPVGRHGRPVRNQMESGFVPAEYAAQLELQNYQLRMTLLQMQSSTPYPIHDTYSEWTPAPDREAGIPI